MSNVGESCSQIQMKMLCLLLIALSKGLEAQTWTRIIRHPRDATSVTLYSGVSVIADIHLK